MRRLTRSLIDRDALAERGFTTVGLLGRRERRRLRRRWDALDVDPTENYYATSVHAPRPVARAVDQELKAALRPTLDRLLPDTSTFMAAFIAKGAGGGHVDLHPDWTYTDERAHRSLVFWCPLVDTNASNGAMQVLPATHRRLRGLRGSGEFPSPVADLPEQAVDRARVTVELEAGEAVVWDAALVHGSGPNQSARPRPAAAAARTSADAALVHIHREAGGPLEAYAIGEDYFTTEEFGTRPENGQEIEPWEGVVAPLTVADLTPTG